MADLTLNLEQLLDTLELTEYYPENLTRDDLYQLTSHALQTDRKEDTPLAWQFIQDIVLYNYNARNVKNKLAPAQNVSFSGFRQRRAYQSTDIKSNIHPLDIIVAVFLCCEPTARQDLALHLWTCRLAIPFMIQPYKNMPVSVYLWPLRSLIGQLNKNGEFADKSLIKETMDCIAFIRVGKNDVWSKSYLLDCLIWGPDKTHSTFIHRDSEGSKRTRSSTVDGLVEITSYLPSMEHEERFSGPTILLNLRGDATNNNECQTKIIGELASVTIILTTVDNLEASASVVKTLIGQNSRVIILVSDRMIDVNELSAKVDNLFWDIPPDELEILELEKKRLPDVLKYIKFNVKQMQGRGKQPVVLSDFVKNLSSMTAVVDETATNYKEAFESAKDILTEILNIDDQNRKYTIFPLQEIFWKQWAQKERDYNRFHQLDDDKRKKLNAGNPEELKAQMEEIRSDQYNFILKNDMSKPVKLYIQALASFDSNGSSAQVKRKVFMRFLKLELDNISRQQMSPINKKYTELIDMSASAQEHEKGAIKRQLTELDIEKSNLSFGLENIFRELGQIYEAYEIEYRKKDHLTNEKNNPTWSYLDLPKYLCYSLLDGYPFELLDGEARTIPPQWTKAVLSELENVLKRYNPNVKTPTIRVMSVLGIQSSGKSTLINVMFGLQFPVSAGRCTRGAFMQLVKVHKSFSSVVGNDIDYIAIIDTEGLRTAALSSMESLKHDNELSTFVIGLAQTTVINLMGENATYLQENLPIVVQAFLRMYLVHLHPRCMIVHHNVDKRNREKMLQQGLMLQNILDELTKRACETEKVPQKTFRDIIAFDVVEHSCYIPSLLEGVLPMAPVSLGYSSEADCTREKLFEMLRQENVQYSATKYSIQSFSEHLFHLWNAILKDNFLYEFRTTVEVAQRLEIDRRYLQILLLLIEDVHEAVSRKTKRIETRKTTSREACVDIETSLERKLQEHQISFENFYRRQKQTTQYLPDQWRLDYIDSLKRKHVKLLSEARDQLREIESKTSRRHKMSEQEMENFLQRCNDVSFDEAWVELKDRTFTMSRLDIFADTTEALNDVCFSSRHLLHLDVVNRKTRLSDFTIEDGKHINHPFEQFTELDICRIKGLMVDIINSVIREYESEKLNMKTRDRNLPYSSRIPKRILLRVERNLSARLQSEDSLRGISNQFKIDLLSCVAMTCVNDMKGMFKRNADAEAESLKRFLRSCVYSEMKLEHNLSMAIFELIDNSIGCTFSGHVVFYMLDGLQKSVYKHAIGSKKLLIGSCLKYFIENGRDDVMTEYIINPKIALKHYLSIHVNVYIVNQFLDCDFQFYIRRAIDNVWRAFETVACATETENASNEAIEAILTHIDVPSEVKEAAYLHFKKIFKRNKRFDLPLLRDMMLHYVESFIGKELRRYRQKILEKQGEFVSVLADTLTENLIGCLHRCDKCQEICLLSDDHTGDHIYLHRLIDSGNDISHRVDNIISIWKWINYQKRDILLTKHLAMVQRTPEQWRTLTKKEVISDIMDLFEIT